jgi:hypothetical protein
MRIARRLFVVPFANNQHGKSTLLRALTSQGIGLAIKAHRKGERQLVSPRGRPIDAFIFGRSFQEVEKKEHKTVERALDKNDPNWRTRELIIMPSHITGTKGLGVAADDLDQMIVAAHSAGFDCISVAIIITRNREEQRSSYSPMWSKPWDERWTVPNPAIDLKSKDKIEAQLEALGHDLWSWICQSLAPS